MDKYRQIVEGVIEGVRDGKLRRGDLLPSVSAVRQSFGLAKATVIKAYALLVERGIVHALPRKGYFVATESVEHKAKVMLLFDEFPAYKQTLYDSLIAELGSCAFVDIYFHHCLPALFRSLLLDNIRHCDLAVVMPFADRMVQTALAEVDGAKILILDRADHARDDLSRVVQEFGMSAFLCLDSAKELLAKYRRFFLVFPPKAGVAIKSSQAPREIVRGFEKFCRAQGMDHQVVPAASDLPLEAGDVILLIDDNDLVAVVERARASKLALGRDIGLISYNDTPMKRVIDRGITVISTDFAEMGKRTARFVLDRKPIKETVPTRLIVRDSL